MSEDQPRSTEPPQGSKKLFEWCRQEPMNAALAIARYRARASLYQTWLGNDLESHVIDACYKGEITEVYGAKILGIHLVELRDKIIERYGELWESDDDE